MKKKDLKKLLHEYRKCVAGDTLYRDTGYSRFCEIQRQLYGDAPELIKLALLGKKYKKAVRILQKATDDHETKSLIKLIRLLELDCNCEYERAEEAETELKKHDFT